MNRPWMPLYIADYLKDTTHLGALESGAYLHLIMHYWQHGSLPTNERQLAQIAKLTAREWKRSCDTLKSFFQDGWRHKRIDQELAHAVDVSAKRSAAAAAKHAAAKEQQASKQDANADADAHTLHTSHSTKKEEVGGAEAPPDKVVPIRRYAFEGRVIRLDQSDLNRWRETYRAIPDIMAVLQSADDYYTQSPPKDGKWFFPVSNWLKRENDLWGEKIRVASARPDRSF
jgi:uncharacterized protein YdaU (DUF1376 family)